MGGLTNNNTIYEIHDFENNQAPAISAEILDKMELGIKEAVENKTDKTIFLPLSLKPNLWKPQSQTELIVYNSDEDIQFQSLQNYFKDNIYVDIILNNNAINNEPDLMYSLVGWFDSNNNICLGLSNQKAMPTNVLNIYLIIHNNITTNQNYVHVDTSGIKETVNLDPLDSIYLSFNKDSSGKKDANNWVISSVDGETATKVKPTDISEKSMLYPSEDNEVNISFKAIQYNDNGNNEIWDEITERGDWRNFCTFGPNNTLIYCYRNKLYFWKPTNDTAENGAIQYTWVDLSDCLETYVPNGSNKEIAISINLKNYTAQDNKGYYTGLEDDTHYLSSSKVIAVNNNEFLVACSLIDACNIQPHSNNSWGYDKYVALSHKMLYFVFDINELSSGTTTYSYSWQSESYVEGAGANLINIFSSDEIDSINIKFETGYCKRNNKRYYFTYYKGLYLQSDEFSEFSKKQYLCGYSDDDQEIYDDRILEDYVELLQAQNYFAVSAPSNSRFSIYYLNHDGKIEVDRTEFDKDTPYMYTDKMRGYLFNHLPYVNSKNVMYFSLSDGIVKRLTQGGIMITNTGLPTDLIPVSEDRFISTSKKLIYDENLVPYTGINEDLTNIRNPALYEYKQYLFMQKDLNKTQNTIIKDNIFYKATADENKLGIYYDSLKDLTSKITPITEYINVYNLKKDNDLLEKLPIIEFTENKYWVSQITIKYGQYNDTVTAVRNPFLNQGFNQSYHSGFACNNLFISSEDEESKSAIHFDTENYTNLIQLPLLEPLCVTNEKGEQEPKAFYWIKINDKPIE